MISKIGLTFFGVLLSLAADRSLAFSNNNLNVGNQQQQQQLSAASRGASSLNMGVAISQDDDWFQMQSAQECAYEDTCSLEEAKKSFDNVMRIQSKCASGAINSAVCDNAATSAELFALLRQKIETKMSAMKSVSNVSTVSLAAIMCLSAFVVAGTGSAAINPDVIPFTPQEWFWAARDGYLPTMLHHYFQDGGLATVDHFDPETTPFTLQELWWSIKGGYLTTMTDHFFQHGGLATSAGYQPEATFLTQQEWYWSIRDGYFGEITKQNFQLGGLSTSMLDAQADGTVPMTPKEIQMALQGGYINDLFSHNFRNGGL
jgi:hypothetical protein